MPDQGRWVCLDLFCGAGGDALAGVEVIGMDCHRAAVEAVASALGHRRVEVVLRHSLRELPLWIDCRLGARRPDARVPVAQDCAQKPACTCPLGASCRRFPLIPEHSPTARPGGRRNGT
jgi:hypothetical protein